MTGEAPLGSAIEQQPDFTGVRGIDDDAFLADDPDTVDALVGRDVLDDLVDVLAAILQHRKTRAADDHLGELIQLIHGRGQQLVALVVDD